MKRFLLPAIAALVLGGCNGGTPVLLVPASPAQRTGTIGTVSPPGTVYVVVTLTVPRPQATPKLDPQWGYISPASKSISVSLYGTIAKNLSPLTAGCHPTAAGLKCRLLFLAKQRASQVATVELFDGTVGSGGSPTGHVLSYAQKNVVIGSKGRPFALRLGAIMGKISASLSKTQLPGGSKSAATLSLTVKDAGGYTIPNPETYLYDFESEVLPFGINVTITDPTNEDAPGFQLLVGGKVQEPTSAYVDRSDQIVTIQYLGRGGHDLVVGVRGPTNTLDLPIAALPAFGKRIDVGAIGKPESISQDPSGRLWLPEPAFNKLASIDPKNGHALEIALPRGSTPWLVACPIGDAIHDNPVDFATTNNAFGIVVDPGNKVREYTVPSPNAGVSGIWIDGPPYFDVWFSERSTGKIGELDPHGYFREYNAPIGSTPVGISGGFFTDPGLNAIGYVHSDGGIGEYPLPHADSQPMAIAAAGQSSNQLHWFTEANAARVGRIDGYGTIAEFRTKAPLKTIVSGRDSWTYGIDARDNIEMIAPNGKITIVSNPVPGTHLTAIGAGFDYDLWLVASNGTTASLVDFIY